MTELGDYKIALPKIPKQYKIIFQENVINHLEGSKTLHSHGVFAVEVDGETYLADKASGKKGTISLTKVIVWKASPGGIYSDGTEEYQIPDTLARRLFDAGKIHFDETNQSYACYDRRVYR